MRPKQTTLAGSNYRAMPLKEQVEKATDRLRPVAGGDEVSTSEREDFLRPIFSQSAAAVLVAMLLRSRVFVAHSGLDRSASSARARA
jgi:hypothetical protein